MDNSNSTYDYISIKSGEDDTEQAASSASDNATEASDPFDAEFQR
jgi:hypothetical protein